MAKKIVGDMSALPGMSKDLFRQLDDGSLTLAHLQAFLEHRNPFIVPALVDLVFRLMPAFYRDMRKEKWELLADHPAQDGDFTPGIMEFLKDGEDYVTGDEMVKRTESDDNAGQRHAEAMLREQDKIPEEWRKHVLVFTKTTWRGPRGYRNVACLAWDGGHWCLGFCWLEFDFGRNSRVVRLRKVSSGT